MITFDCINLTSLTSDEVLAQATENYNYMVARCGESSYTLQEAVDSVIMAHIEHTQGNDND